MIEEKLKRICFGLIALSVVAMVAVYVSGASNPHRDLIFAIGFSVASAIFSTCTVILIFDVWLGKDIRAERERQTQSAIGVSIRRAMGFRAHGVIGIYAGFNLEKFSASARKSKNIFILQTYAPNMQAIRTCLLDVLNRDGEVRMAVLDPESEFAKIRASEMSELHISDPLEAFKSNIVYDCVARFMKISKNKTAGSALLKFYDRSPGVCIYATDQMMLVGPFLSNTDALDAPMIEIEANTDAYQKFIEHFNSIWDGAVVKKF